MDILAKVFNQVTFFKERDNDTRVIGFSGEELIFKGETLPKIDESQPYSVR